MRTIMVVKKTVSYITCIFQKCSEKWILIWCKILNRLLTKQIFKKYGLTYFNLKSKAHFVLSKKLFNLESRTVKMIKYICDKLKCFILLPKKLSWNRNWYVCYDIPNVSWIIEFRSRLSWWLDMSKRRQHLHFIAE